MFETTQKVLFRHCDPAGIVFFPRAFEIANDLVERFFAEALDWPFEDLLRDAGVPTAEIATRFRAPSRHGDVLRLRLALTKLGRTSLAYRLDAQCGGEPRWETRATLVHVGAGGRPAPWPDAVRLRLADHLEPAP
ncbi:thioesterase family protein [Jannaschia sp. W003]|uniref:acyl-CoA thioesterase n=1 Tax=Jannaschia sp. W003 TaxID=2867012 RepID=UPI0021A5ECA2|nr:thioesterase family protein [Jannaschia sp. W003]UWQ22678.1 acyl-CoA thioesterase [Jannaschia sp. W003]